MKFMELIALTILPEKPLFLSRIFGSVFYIII